MLALTHRPVLVRETVEALAVQPGGRYIDCTLGGGGHAAVILEQSAPGGQLLGIDADPDAIRIARTRLESYSASLLLVNENFSKLQSICHKYDFSPVHGILFDLGLSSFQLNGDARGFSFQHEAVLDMRLSPDQELTADDIVNQFPEDELAHLIKMYGEEIYNRRIARRIVQERPIETTLQLAQIIEQAVGGRRGRLVVISYHSLEDRIVKRFMQRESRDCVCPPGTPSCVCGHTAKLRLINKRIITPSTLEVELNPRSRSARLRAAERIINQDEQSKIAEALRYSVEMEANGWRRPAMLKKLKMAFSTY